MKLKTNRFDVRPEDEDDPLEETNETDEEGFSLEADCS